MSAPPDFLETFSTCVARRDYGEALAVCNKRLKEIPGDRFALELRQSIEEFNTALVTSQVDGAETTAEPPPTLEELQPLAREASSKGFEAMYSYLQDDEQLWTMGEQAVGIFFDAAVIAPHGPARDRLMDISRSLLQVLEPRLHAARGMDGNEGLPEHCYGSWLFEALGLLWWQDELGQGTDKELLASARKEWTSLATMTELVGYSKDALGNIPNDEMCDVMVMVWTLERSLVCGLMGPADLPMEYGMEEVFAEIRTRPLFEPPFAGFYNQFYLMTHLVYCLNSWNGYLPNSYGDCPWLYNYVERCLRFWLLEAKQHSTPDALSSMRPSYASETVDGAAEAIDCIRGLGPERVTEVVREGLGWLLTRQQDDGFFASPGAETSGGRLVEDDEYNKLHPTWVSCGALQLDRENWATQLQPSKNAAIWAKHARAAAERAGFSEPPPTGANRLWTESYQEIVSKPEADEGNAGKAKAVEAAPTPVKSTATTASKRTGEWKPSAK